MMKELKKDLLTLMKDLKSLSVKVERMAKKVDKIEKRAVAAKAKVKVKVKTKAKPTKKAVAGRTKSSTAGDVVFDAIKGSQEGLDTAMLKKKTGFADLKIRNIVFRLKKQGMIKTKARGVYVKA